MSSEPRHGPVTMHRAIERAMLKRITTRPPDAPRSRPHAAEGTDEPPGAEPAERGAEPRGTEVLRRVRGNAAGRGPRKPSGRGPRESSG